jgi:hypothetical protein
LTFFRPHRSEPLARSASQNKLEVLEDQITIGSRDRSQNTKTGEAGAGWLSAANDAGQGDPLHAKIKN